MIYVRKKTSDTWHWMECSHQRRWLGMSDARADFAARLLSGFTHSRKRPKGDLCNECRSLERKAGK